MEDLKEGTSKINFYISEFPTEVQVKLYELRNLILEIVPEAEEKFAYGMPTFYYYKNLVHFAVNKNHIGFYPTPSGVDYFLKLTDKYPTSKGAIKFDINEDLPFDLIRKVVEYRKEEIYNLYSKKKSK